MTWLGQPAYYTKLKNRKTQNDESIWKEALRGSSDHGAISEPTVDHIRRLYGVSVAKAKEICKLRTQSILEIDRARGRDEGPYQQ